jgi:hypothetical protein
MKLSRPVVLASILTAAAFGASTASAQTTLNVTDTVTSPTTGDYTYVLSGLAANGSISPTDTLTLGDAFNGPGQQQTGVNFDATAGTGYNTTPWNFQDDFVFSTPGATVTTATIALPSVSMGGTTTGITDLQVRIIYAVYAGSPVNGPPTVGNPVGGTLVDAWENINPNGTFSVTMPTALTGGEYILQIRGEAATNGGSYGGTISFTPAPLPAGLPLLLSGLALLGCAAATRRWSTRAGSLA